MIRGNFELEGQKGMVTCYAPNKLVLQLNSG